jgi:hemerythrin superfamily protein
MRSEIRRYVVRSLADQTVEELGGRRSILHRQKRDHVKLDRMLERLPDTSGNEQDELLDRICRLVFRHAFAEEAVLWPALRRSVADGEELTARVEREHQEITELVASLEQTAAGDPKRAQLIDRTVAMLRQDARDEEDLLLPRLQEAGRHPDAAPTRRELGAGAADRADAHPSDRLEAPAGTDAVGAAAQCHRPAARRPRPRRPPGALTVPAGTCHGQQWTRYGGPPDRAVAAAAPR